MLKIFLLFFISALYLYDTTNAFDTKAYEEYIRNMSPGTRLKFNQHLKNLLEADEDYFAYKPSGDEFNCDLNYMNTELLNEKVTVNNLKPSDVKVIAAVGDSLTAGLGGKATNVVELLYEYRGT